MEYCHNQSTKTPHSLHLNTIGQGPDIVMLHGWGMNSAVFMPLQQGFSQYRVHYVDLPGFGFSPSINGSIDDWVDAIIDIVPDNSIWCGWSLGGLIASRAALRYPHKIKALLTIASSPYFMEQDKSIIGDTKKNTDISWPGMAPQVLEQFHHALSLNLTRTINQFLSIQAMGSQHAKNDIKQLKSLISERPAPQINALTQGLNILARTDLREDINQINQPWLRIWGRLDGLVPQIIHTLMPQKKSITDIVLPKASHAPFISHPKDFLDAVHHWLNKLNDSHH
ncbi:pimeloyl-ACP methyl ester esterase BioH [uncultured Shewanella sp.]|uniref:pimeloyl-ACP methyl ester esterase BioH n=1 Tax=uncultured Shewanella sp. TaxID=173975 RepID=UPI00260230CA|nr:pimeloyl-ACP methyl ester esterase BioH [uncultured Shewanella sp.]